MKPRCGNSLFIPRFSARDCRPLHSNSSRYAANDISRHHLFDARAPGTTRCSLSAKISSGTSRATRSGFAASDGNSLDSVNSAMNELASTAATTCCESSSVAIVESPDSTEPPASPVPLGTSTVVNPGALLVPWRIRRAGRRMEADPTRVSQQCNSERRLASLRGGLNATASPTGRGAPTQELSFRAGQRRKLKWGHRSARFRGSIAAARLP